MINNSQRKQLAREALQLSSSIRKKVGYDSFSGLSIFDLCEAIDVPVRFVDINMEGMYVQMGEGIKPTILISALRPFHRKIFTCSHELGHHVFGHGFTIDEVVKSGGQYTKEEFLVDAFSSFLLMPPLGIKSAMSKRGLEFQQLNPIDCLKISSSFGVGYSTLINHLYFNGYIGKNKSDCLLGASLKSIKQSILGEPVSETLFVVDKHFSNKTIDIEAPGLILLPRDFEVENANLLKVKKEVLEGIIYEAVSPGITRAYSRYTEWSSFVRIQRFQYVGLSRFRHLSD